MVPPELVDEMIKKKTAAKGQSMRHPEFPEIDAAVLYYMLDEAGSQNRKPFSETRQRLM